MNITTSIQSGISEETTFIVEDQHTASQIGSGSLKVLSTPYLITVMEKTCHQLLAKRLPERFVQCGGSGECQASGAYTIGQQVRVRVEVIQAEGIASLSRFRPGIKPRNLGRRTPAHRD